MNHEPDIGRIAKTMRNTRQDAKISREKLAHDSRIGFQSLRNYETGRCYPGLYNLWQLCDSLDVSMDDYTGFSDYRRRMKQ